MSKFLKLIVALIFVSLLIFVGFYNSNVYVKAQETPKKPLEIAYEAYQVSMEEYTKTHETYVVQRSRYLRFKTLQSKQDAYNATLAMLKARDEVVNKYIEVLKKRLDDSIGIPQIRVEGLKLLLNERQTWFGMGYRKSGIYV